MNDNELRPLVDPGSGAPLLLRDALAAARAEVPASAQLASLAAKLASLPDGGSAPSVGDGGSASKPQAPAAGSGAPATVAATSPSVLSGALIGAGLGVLVSGAAFLWEATHPPPAFTPRAVATAPAGHENDAPRAPVEAPPAAADGPRARAVGAPSAAPRAAQAPASASAAAQPSAANAEPASSASPAEPAFPSAGAVGSAADTETEAHLLQRAQDALAASPAQALALTQEHVSRFPGGSLGQEREVVAIQALLRLGRADEARARGARFAAAFPGSAHRRRIDAILAP